MQLTKHHGLGNDFLVALASEIPFDGADLARAWCHRTTGVGADGLIFGTPSDEADLEMTLFNSDGSRAEISGNGIRCLAQAYLQSVNGAAAQAADRAGAMSIVAGGQVREVSCVTSKGAVAEISVHMGAVAPGPAHPDVDEMTFPGPATLRAGTGDVGNPHVVLLVEALTGIDPTVHGPPIQKMWAPEGINVHFMQHSGLNEITLLHWERGAGATAACGSGASVAATLANRWGLVASGVTVRMPGGIARVVLDEGVTLVGPAVLVARIEVDDG